MVVSDSPQIEHNITLVKVEAESSESAKKISYPIIKVQNLDHSIVMPSAFGNYELLIGAEYLLTVSKIGYYTFRDTINVSNVTSGSSYTHTVKMKKVMKGESFKIDNIYYEKNSAQLTFSSKRELDKLADFMIDNPSINIEVGSYTDSKGSATYNKKISQKRAEAASTYLTAKGISSTRITPVGYGESKLLNECTDGKECLEFQHKINRRTEVKILSPNR